MFSLPQRASTLCSLFVGKQGMQPAAAEMSKFEYYSKKYVIKAGHA